MKNSFFIKDGFAQDYCRNKTVTESQGAATNTSIEGSMIVERSAQKLTTKETKAQIAIPPGSRKVVNYFNLRNSLFNFCGLKEYLGWDDTTSVKFNATNSPFTFKNFVTYSFNEDLSSSKEVEHEFRVYKVENIDGSNFSKEKDVQAPCNSKEEQ